MSLQVSGQNHLFQYNNNVFGDFGFSKKQIAKYKSQGTLSVFNKEKHNSNLANRLFELREGGSITLKRATKKKLTVLKKMDVEHYRLNYIFLDGKQMPYEDLDALRDRILKLSKTRKFENLAQRYSMDLNRNRGGDSGWFKSNSVPEQFKNASLSSMRAANEIFKVDLDQMKWYYLVLKSYSPKMIEEILVLETTK